MNNKGEIFKALNDGYKIYSINRGKGFVHLVDDVLVNHEGLIRDLDFRAPSEWQIYKEPKWYENIPDGGVLCWADEVRDMPALIIRYSNAEKVFVSGWGARYSRSTPLTKQEIQVFMDNAPEIMGCRHNLLPDNPSSPQYYKCTKCNHVQGAAK